jgi:hypothetical protein
MKTFIALALASAVSATPLSDIEHKFMGYMTQYGKSYGTIEEYQYRLVQFARNYAAVISHNADTTATFKLGYNQMSDWTADEYSRLLTYVPMPESEKFIVASSIDLLTTHAANMYLYGWPLVMTSLTRKSMFY